jgi:hypothetical protein
MHQRRSRRPHDEEFMGNARGVRGGGKVSPLYTLAGLLMLGGAIGLWQRRPGETPVPAAIASGPSTSALALAAPLSAAEACRNVGYLCSDLERTARIQLHRWKDHTGPIVVHVPRPDFESSGDATRLQQAASIGLRAWNGQPFEIITDLRGEREAHFAVVWRRVLESNRIGVAHTRWSAETGLQVVEVELSTRSPFGRGEVIDAEQVRLTAAHEMGHALGLPHSPTPQDVMYPSNTATSLSAQDYRSMESLYRMPDGTEILR